MALTTTLDSQSNDSHHYVQELVSRTAAGDHEAYSELVDQYKESLYRLALRILGRPLDAEDAVQEAFIKAYVHLDRYDSTYRFYTWISAILTNTCYSALRARDWHVSIMPEQLLQAFRGEDPVDEPEMAALVSSRDQLLQNSLADLPERYRQILVMRYWGDLSYNELADATGQSLGAVKTQIRRATLLLRAALVGSHLELVPEST